MADDQAHDVVATLELQAAGASDLSVRAIDLREGISQVFDARVTVRASGASIDLESCLGADATLTVEAGRGGQRTQGSWTGVCHRIEQTQAEPTGLSTYVVHVASKLWLLGQRRGYRIHQHLDARGIVDKVLGDWGLQATWSISATLPKWNYRVQYDETDLAFVSRTLEEVGVAYTISAQQGDASKLTMNDTLGASQAAARSLPWVDNPSERELEVFVTKLVVAHELRPAAYTIRDYDFRRPALALFGEAGDASSPERPMEQYRYKPGAFLVEGGSADGATPTADDQGVVRASQTEGTAQAERALAAAREGRRAVRFVTNALDVAPGSMVKVERHPSPELDGASLLVVTRHVAFDLEHWSATCGCVLPDGAYRPPLVTPKRPVDGVQSATVVGKSGSEIEVDEFGRVRVQFPWDRDGKDDDKSSCWLRVSEGWAGTGFGFVTLPRIGQEVLVGFLDGDADQPIIVGRVFNASNPVPYKLPDNKTRSTWMSKSSPGGDGFNELTFEDLAGQELVYFQAQKDHRKLVKHDEAITVVGDRDKLVKKDELEAVLGERFETTEGDRTELDKTTKTTAVGGVRRDLVKGDAIEQIDGDEVVRVGGDRHLVVKGVQKELVQKDRHVRVKGDRQEQVGGTYGLTAGSHQIACGSQAVGAGKYIHMKAGADIVLEAPDITLKAPGGFIRIDGSGVTIVGTLVKINSGGAPPVVPIAGGGNPEPPKIAVVPVPDVPVPEDVSKTGIGR